MYRLPPVDNARAISDQVEVPNLTAVREVDYSAAESDDSFYSDDSEDSDDFQGKRYNDVGGQGARDSEASKISLPLFQILNLDQSSIYSLQGDEAAEIGSKIQSVRSQLAAGCREAYTKFHCST